MKNHLNIENKNSLTFQFNVAVVGCLLFIGKILAWRLTASQMVFSEAMESLVNILAAFMGLYSLYLAGKPKDKDHPYGHGKVEFITAGAEGIFIIVAGIVILINAFDSWFESPELKNLDTGILIVGITAGANFLLGHYSIVKGKKENSPILLSSGKHLKTDTLTTFGVILGMILVYFTHWFWLDSLVAIFFGGYIVLVGYGIVRESFSGIMDEVDYEIIIEIAEILESERKNIWIDVHNMKIQRFGSNLHIDAHITFPWYFELRKAHNEMKEVLLCIAYKMDRKIEFNFHMDDCKTTSCAICQVEDCPFREEKFVKKIRWNLDTITQPQKHTIENFSDAENEIKEKKSIFHTIKKK